MKNVEINEVHTLKMNSGEEVIAKIISVDSVNNLVVLSKPLSVAPGPQGFGLMPTMFTAETESPVMINSKNIAMWSITADQIRIKYIEATTGITTSSKKIVLG